MATRRPWSPREDAYLRRNYGKVSADELAKRLGRTMCAIRLRAQLVGIAERHPRWTPKEDQVLRTSYGKVRPAILAGTLGRPVGSVHNRAHDLGLTRHRTYSWRAWTPEEDRVLRDNYGNRLPRQIAKMLGRTRSSVYHRAEKLQLFSYFGSPDYRKRQSLPRAGKWYAGLDEVSSGYVAGILDGEGSIQKPPSLAISVTTTTRALADRLVELAGGTVTGPYLYQKTRMFGRKRCRLKPQYHWNFSSRYHTYLLLKRILPYLVVKAQEADRAVTFIEKTYGWHADETNKPNRD